uniref:Uncharacterized protein n=1 Tax=Acetobacter pasteurianus TaxID=438 RepID=I3W083_ACEPA|nr:hypothetical protein [Acetobacter pasteurianus]
MSKNRQQHTHEKRSETPLSLVILILCACGVIPLVWAIGTAFAHSVVGNSPFTP